ncbi:hypothetical protein HYPDE_26798 [Hyphomicrobium denitrificans 1NES1]|uniref:Transcription regulator PadR N-terminal domain-containing protein n=1 Tax=Hyphomicrobium denitrificans 1NES1 TaxID=670307 RepID=N0BAB3_9HYPH|nr:helix-turn-helix transcriptional regulator [Hyphomicrobium denitrificans]AGK57040.1 hypothetical protein HYPDE_26798 [Hyphomicrobium denitrificans 1NES1]
MKKLPSEQEHSVLDVMIVRPRREMYGLEIQRAAGNTVSKNTIYIVLARMVARGYLSSRDETWDERPEPGPRRVLYKITGFGQQMHAVGVNVRRQLSRLQVAGAQRGGQ